MATTTQPNLSQQVLRHIYKQVSDGVLKKGDKLPTNRELAEELEVSILTVQRSMKQLEAQGTVTCHRRTGTFLADPNSIHSPKVQSGIIGLFVPGFVGDFHLDLLQELEKGMMQQGKLVSINFTHSDPEREITLLKTLARQRLEALVYFPSPLVIKSESYCKRIGSWVDRYSEEGTQVFFADLCPPGYEDRLISLDDRQAGKILTQELILRGHRKIAFLGATHLLSSKERLAGYHQTLKKASLPVNEAWQINVPILESSWEKYIQNEIKKFLSNNPEVSGFVVSDQRTAEILYGMLKEKPKRKFKAEHAVASLFETPTPPFEAVAWMHIPGKRMGLKVKEILFGDHPADYRPGHIKIKPTLFKD
ncbi:MAG: GntR family transcriptional regulator [Opitutales bacterium]